MKLGVGGDARHYFGAGSLEEKWKTVRAFCFSATHHGTVNGFPVHADRQQRTGGWWGQLVLVVACVGRRPLAEQIRGQPPEIGRLVLIAVLDRGRDLGLKVPQGCERIARRQLAISLATDHEPARIGSSISLFGTNYNKQTSNHALQKNKPQKNSVYFVSQEIRNNHTVF